MFYNVPLSWSNRYLALGLWPHFANSANNTAMIGTFTVSNSNIIKVHRNH